MYLLLAVPWVIQGTFPYFLIGYSTLWFLPTSHSVGYCVYWRDTGIVVRPLPVTKLTPVKTRTRSHCMATLIRRVAIKETTVGLHLHLKSWCILQIAFIWQSRQVWIICPISGMIFCSQIWIWVRSEMSFFKFCIKYPIYMMYMKMVKQVPIVFYD